LAHEIADGYWDIDITPWSMGIPEQVMTVQGNAGLPEGTTATFPCKSLVRKCCMRVYGYGSVFNGRGVVIMDFLSGIDA